MKADVLHITPHLGGGVGQVLLNWVIFDKSNIHKIVTLDFANQESFEVCKKNNIELFSQAKIEKILSLIKESDIVVIHFWNHPLLYDFLIRNKLPESRVIVYSHVSGLMPPNLITKKILNYPDKFIYTTSISQKIDNKCDFILSTKGVENLKDLKVLSNDEFTVGYIGTVDYAKMHPEYIKTLSKLKNVKFLIVGGENEKEISKAADGRFTFCGKVEDIRPYLIQMDVFGYLLNPKHFGTAEQVLQEAMAAGSVPVVLSNECEVSLVRHYKTGLVADNLDKYIEFIELLQYDKKLRQKLSKEAKKYAIQAFSIDSFCQKWNCVFNKILDIKKTSKNWEIKNKNLSSLDIFLESLGGFSETFMSQPDVILKELNWKSKSKGTPIQYFDFLGGDKLKKIVDLYE